MCLLGIQSAEPLTLSYRALPHALTPSGYMMGMRKGNSGQRD